MVGVILPLSLASQSLLHTPYIPGIYSPFLPPSPLCQLRPWYPLFPRFRCGRLGQLPARLVFFVSGKSWAYCHVPCSGCGAFFMTWYVSSPAASKAFHAFACGGSSCLLASLLAPSPTLGLGVRAGYFNIFHLGLGLLQFTDLYRSVMRNANYFSFAFGLFCLRPIQHCCLTFIFTFSLWCLVFPIQSDMIEHQKMRPNFGGFCLEIEESFR